MEYRKNREIKEEKGRGKRKRKGIGNGFKLDEVWGEMRDEEGRWTMKGTIGNFLGEIKEGMGKR